MVRKRCKGKKVKSRPVLLATSETLAKNLLRMRFLYGFYIGFAFKSKIGGPPCENVKERSELYGNE